MAVATLVGWGLVIDTTGAGKGLSWLGFLLGPLGLGGRDGAWAYANLGVPVALAVGFVGYLGLQAGAVRRQESGPLDRRRFTRPDHRRLTRTSQPRGRAHPTSTQEPPARWAHEQISQADDSHRRDRALRRAGRMRRTVVGRAAASLALAAVAGLGAHQQRSTASTSATGTAAGAASRSSSSTGGTYPVLRQRLLPRGDVGLVMATAGTEWELWSTRARLVVTDPGCCSRRGSWSTPTSPTVTWTPPSVLPCRDWATTGTCSSSRTETVRWSPSHAPCPVTATCASKVPPVPPGRRRARPRRHGQGRGRRTGVPGSCEALGVRVLVSLGGDIATAGAAPGGGWQIHVQDRDDDPWTQVALPAGRAVATSSTVSRQWRRGGRTLHHIVDPRTGQSARGCGGASRWPRTPVCS